MTQQERFEAAAENRQAAVTDALEAFKHRHKLSNEQIGREIGIGARSMSKIMNGEPVVIKTDVYWKLLILLGIDPVKRGDP